jgi:hypothetical protein
MDDDHDSAAARPGCPFRPKTPRITPITARLGDAKHRHGRGRIAGRSSSTQMPPPFVSSPLFIKFNLLKRAEGELTRLLALSLLTREACDR